MAFRPKGGKTTPATLGVLAARPFLKISRAVSAVSERLQVWNSYDVAKGLNMPPGGLSFFQPRFSLGAQPSYGIDVSFEGINLLSRAVGPFCLDPPIFALAQHHVEQRLRHRAHTCPFTPACYPSPLKRAVELLAKALGL
jgi:hypothetical protein